MIRKAALVALLILSWVTTRVGALGLGEIEADSSLNEPLNARIPLRSLATDEERESIQVNLASAEQFTRAGLERPFILTRIRFSVVDAPGGGAAIRLSTRDPVKEPFLNFLVELNWPQGRVVREFTLLLDPPVFDVRAGDPAASQGFGSTVSRPTIVDPSEPRRRAGDSGRPDYSAGLPGKLPNLLYARSAGNLRFALELWSGSPQRDAVEHCHPCRARPPR